MAHYSQPPSKAEGKTGGKAANDDDHKHGDDLEGLHGHDHGPTEGPWWKSPKARLTLLCAAAFGAAFLLAKVVPQSAPWGYVAAMMVGLIPIVRRAAKGVARGYPFSIETLMTIAAIGAIVIDAAEEAAVVVVLFLVGELLEGIAADRARSSIRELATLVPKDALLDEGDGKTRKVPAEELAVDAIVVVRPGDRVPADGVIVQGESAIDEAPVTGESVPKRKTVDDQVFAGTINQEGVLRIKVTAAAENNTISRVIKLVEDAQEAKAPTERFIDGFSKYYTPGVIAFAFLVTVIPPLAFGGDWSEWLYKGLAVLLIGCPCALVISTPAAIAAALSAGAKRGLLMKGGAVLETFRKVTYVAMDKTGTLTEGKPKLTDIHGNGMDEAEVLRIAATLEAGSSHPLATAILNEAKARNIDHGTAESSKAVAGKGVAGTVDGKSVRLYSPKATEDYMPLGGNMRQSIQRFNDEGKTVSVLIVNDEIAGFIAMRDEPREDAKAGVWALQRQGITTLMLTGDNKRTGEAIASQLGMQARTELMPEEKQTIVKDLQDQGEVVAKVGDGINDAPALAAADVGIAMGGGTDVALETADAAVLHGRVMDIADMIGLSRLTMTNIYQNITIALGLKAVFLVTTVLGITGLWPAILADTGATVFVTANAMRLLGWKGGRDA
jgi:Cd2+/Zn2+-exporting ATPase